MGKLSEVHRRVLHEGRVYTPTNDLPFVGCLVCPSDGSTYVGRVTRASKEDDVVEHVCTKTGATWSKSWFGFFCRYMVLVEVTP